jgi:hypothetical protein
LLMLNTPSTLSFMSSPRILYFLHLNTLFVPALTHVVRSYWTDNIVLGSLAWITIQLSYIQCHSSLWLFHSGLVC